MDELNVTSVNAEQVSDEGSQIQTETEQVDTSVESVEAAEPQKPVQSAEENAKYAAIRREAEQKAAQKALDDFIAKQGYEYNGKRIQTHAEYEKAIQEVEAEKKRAEIQDKIGVDPDALKPVFQEWKESDPDFQELKAIRAEKNINAALTDLNNELKDAGMDLQLNNLSTEEVAKLPNVDKIVELIKTKGHSLADAFFIANKKDIIKQQAAKAEQEAIKKITANGASSPGSLAAGSDDNSTDIWKMSSAEFKALKEKAIRGELKK